MIKTLTLSNFFENGLVNHRNQRLKLRKDLHNVFNPTGKFYEKQIVKPLNRIPKSTPYFEVVEGVNLFDLSNSELPNLRKIFRLKFTETKGFTLDRLSYLPNLNTLTIQFSIIHYNSKIFSENVSKPFPCLEQLELCFDSLTNDIFYYIRHLRHLRVLNLTGNFITHEICDMRELTSLEELNLSHNKIESFYLNSSLAFTKHNSKNSLILRGSMIDTEIQEADENNIERLGMTEQK
jgi:Leucine-rich repeat (LRR) protein